MLNLDERRPHFGRQLARNTGLLVGTSLVGQGAFAFLFIVMARTNSPSQLGIATASYGVTLILCDVIDFGTSPRMLRDLASGDIGASRIQELFDVRNAIGLVVASLWVISSVWTDLTVIESLLIAVYTLIRINQIALLAMLQSVEAFSRVSRITVIERVVSLVVGAALLLAGASASASLYAGLSTGALVALVLGARFQEFRLKALLRLKIPFKIESYFVYGRIFAVSGLVTDFLMFDAVLVATIAGSREAGFFAIGARLTGPFGVIASSLGTALTPRVASSPNRRSLRSGLLTVGGAGIGITAVILGGIYLAAPYLVNSIFGNLYEPSIPVVRAYALASVVVAVNQPICGFLQASGRAFSVAWVLTIGVVVNLSLVSWGAAQAGAHGASGGYFLANSVVLLMFLVVLRFGRLNEKKVEGTLLSIPTGRLQDDSLSASTVSVQQGDDRE